MLYISLIFLVFCFLKSIYYGIYEFKSQQNKKAGIFITILSLIGLILPTITLFISY